MLRHLNGSVDKGKDVVRYEVPLAEYTNTCTISIEQLTMLHKLLKFHLCHRHQTLDFATWPIEVLDAKGIDCHHLDAALVANLKHSG